MRILCFKLFFLLSLATQAAPAKLIGSTALSDKIFTRIFEPTTPTQYWTLVDLYFFSNPPYSFVEQLGFYDVSSFEIKNGVPNSYNMILMGVLIDNISQLIADACLPLKKGPKLQGALQNSVTTLCAWPALSSVDENVLVDFFHQLTVFDASFEEKQAWLAHFQHPDYLQKSASEVIYEMSFTLLMNPHFLLKK